MQLVEVENFVLRRAANQHLSQFVVLLRKQAQGIVHARELHFKGGELLNEHLFCQSGKSLNLIHVDVFCACLPQKLHLGQLELVNLNHGLRDVAPTGNLVARFR